MKPWEVLSRRVVYSARPYLEVSLEKVKLPDGRVIDDYHQVDGGSFAGIVAETDDRKIMLLRQYRHGIRRVGLSIPGGRIDPGESTLSGAQRELREETGYSAAEWRPLVEYDASCTYGLSHNNFFHARSLTLVGKPASGDLEQSEIVFLNHTEAKAALFGEKFSSIGDALPIAMLLLNATGCA
jgi:ADP-ribose pyrophosphatase